MQVEIPGDLLDGLLPLERFQHHTGFESGVMSFSFGFHWMGIGFAVLRARVQPNHSLAGGPVFRVQLTGSGIRRVVIHPECLREQNRNS